MVLNFKNLDDIKKARILHLAMHPMLILNEDYIKVDILSIFTQGGYIIFLHGENNYVVPTSWRSHKINRVVSSTLAAETLALTEAAKQGFCIRAILTELLGLHDKKCLPINAITDNQSLSNSIKSTRTADDKRLLINISSIRENWLT